MRAATEALWQLLRTRVGEERQHDGLGEPGWFARVVPGYRPVFDDFEALVSTSTSQEHQPQGRGGEARSAQELPGRYTTPLTRLSLAHRAHCTHLR